MKTPTPNQYALKFLRWFCKEDFIDEIEGDLIEIFEQECTESPRRAKWQFIWQVLQHFRPDFIKPMMNPFFNPALLRHNMTITYRRHLSNKTSFFINLTGLSTALICVLLIFLWAKDELEVDKFNENDAQLYQVMQHFQLPDKIDTWEYSPYILGEALMESFPEIENYTATNDRFFIPKGLMSKEDKHLNTEGIFAKENFFEVFTYPLLRGSQKEVLTGINNIVISDKLALDLFPSYDAAMGQTVHWSNTLNDTLFQVAGIFKSPPQNATRQFDAVIHFDWLAKADEHAIGWNSDYAETFLVLKADTPVDNFNQKIAKFYRTKTEHRDRFTLFAQKYSDRYLYGNYDNGKLAGGRIDYVKLFSIVAFFILLVACINFMNLATAQAAQKMKEIGVKKTIGATRKDLIFQFFSASVLMVFLSLLVAIVAVVFLLPYFNNLTTKQLSLSLAPNIIFSILGLIMFTGLVAGSYPALYLSKFKPIKILKGIRSNAASELWVRKGLVIFQFALSVIFIVGILIVGEQMDYIQSKNLGYDRQNVLCFERPPHDDEPAVFLSNLKTIPEVANASNMYWSVLDGTDSQGGFSWTGDKVEKKVLFKSPRIGYGVVETLDMELLAGRSFSKEHQDDNKKIVINETALKLMGLEDPIGKTIVKGKRKVQIIGVVKDFHYGSIHKKIEPTILRFRNNGPDVMVKIKVGQEMTALEKIENTFKTFHPNHPFNFTFLDEDYQSLYEAEKNIAVLSKYFGLLAIIISCLGLFGMAAFTAEQRSKEIGVRKILGASTWGIVQMLSKDFTQLVGLAILVAIPASYFILQQWLNSFAYQVDMNWWSFGLAAVLTLVIAWCTVSYQTMRAAVVNPVESLRSE